MPIPDLQCSWWPDVWFGVSITNCCIDHDLGGSDFKLLTCVYETFNTNGFTFGASGLVLGIIMYIGIKTFRPVYTKIKFGGKIDTTTRKISETNTE